MATSSDTRPVVDNMDEDDDDLDDLDDVLAQFTTASRGHLSPSPGHALVSPPPPPPTATTTTAFSRPRTNTRVDAPPMSVPGSGPGPSLESVNEDSLSEAFSRELQKGMESLIRELGNNSSNGTEDVPEGELSKEETERRFKAAWEAMLVEEMDGMGQGIGEDVQKSSTSMPDTKSKEGETTNAFKDQIRQAMDKLRESESNLQAGGAKPDPLTNATPESLDALLASFNDLGLGEGEGSETDPELANLLDNMMNQLMTKDVLYEPLKELGDAFPPYLEHPPTPLSDDDRKLYESQLACIRKMLEVFTDPNYSDNDPTMKASITGLMNELQTLGSPPTEIMGPIPSFGADGMLQMGEGCTVA